MINLNSKKKKKNEIKLLNFHLSFGGVSQENNL